MILIAFFLAMLFIPLIYSSLLISSVPSSMDILLIKFNGELDKNILDSINASNHSQERKHMLVAHAALLSNVARIDSKSATLLDQLCCIFYQSYEFVDLEFVSFLEIIAIVCVGMKDFRVKKIIRKKLLKYFVRNHDPIGFIDHYMERVELKKDNTNNQKLIALNEQREELRQDFEKSCNYKLMDCIRPGKKNSLIFERSSKHKKIESINFKVNSKKLTRNYPKKYNLNLYVYIFKVLFDQKEFVSLLKERKYYFSTNEFTLITKNIKELYLKSYEWKKILKNLTKIQIAIKRYNKLAHHSKLTKLQINNILEWGIIYSVYFNYALFPFIDTLIVFILYKKNFKFTLQSLAITIRVSNMVNNQYYKVFKRITDYNFAIISLFIDCITVELYQINNQPYYRHLRLDDYFKLRTSTMLSKFPRNTVSMLVESGIIYESLSPIYFFIYFRNSSKVREPRVLDPVETISELKSIRNAYKESLLKLIFGVHVHSVFRKYKNVRRFLKDHGRFEIYQRLYDALYGKNGGSIKDVVVDSERGGFDKSEWKNDESVNCIIV